LILLTRNDTATFPSVWLYLASVFVALFIASFFLDDIIRARTQAAMNQKLKATTWR
jgi:hypothetical protein